MSGSSPPKIWYGPFHMDGQKVKDQNGRSLSRSRPFSGSDCPTADLADSLVILKPDSTLRDLFRNLILEFFFEKGLNSFWLSHRVAFDFFPFSITSHFVIAVHFFDFKIFRPDNLFLNLFFQIFRYFLVFYIAHSLCFMILC